MIKLKKLLKELADGDIEETELSDVQSIIKRIFAKKYPGVKLYFEQENYINVSTDKENTSAASMYGEGNPEEHFYLSFNLYAEGETLNLVGANANAGPYKGVTADIFKAMFEFGEKKFAPITQKILVTEDDVTGGYWKKLAQTLDVEYENQ